MKLNPNKTYLFIDCNGNVVMLETLNPSQYKLVDSETYVTIQILCDNMFVTDEYVLYSGVLPSEL